MRVALRHLFPPSGPAYELFDTAVLLLVLGFLGYVAAAPPEATTEALPPLRFVSDTTLGLVLTAAALVAMAASYTRWLLAGYVVAFFAALAMMANFFAAWLLLDGSTRTLMSAVIYGWLVRRLIRDSGRMSREGVER